MVRAISLLKAFSSDRPALSVAQLCEEVGLTRTTGHRLLSALESEDLVARDSADGAYRLGPGVIALGAQALRDHDLRTVVQPDLEALADETGETATLEILAGNQMLILSEVKGRHLVTVAPELGTMWPIHTTSTGKAVLATLPPERRRELLRPPLRSFTQSTITDIDALLEEVDAVAHLGYAAASGEIESGAAAVAAALLDARGNALGAISLGGPVSRLTEERIAELGAILQSTAARLSRRLDIRIQ